MATASSQFSKRRFLSLFHRIIAGATCLLIVNAAEASANCSSDSFKPFSPAIAGESYNAAVTVAQDDAWVVGAISSEYATATATLAEHWNGTKWSAVMTPSPGLAPNVQDSLSGVASVASNDVWAVGQAETTPGSPQALIEHWNGAQWSVIPAPTAGNTSSLGSVTATSATSVWAAGAYQDSAGIHALVEMWNGSAWSVVPDPNPGAITSISATSPTDVWATAGDIQRWNGTRWKIVSTLQGSSISAASRNNVWAVVNVNETAHWNGSVWAVSTPPGPANLTGIATNGANNAWAVGQFDSQPYTAHWDGSFWSVVSPPIVGKSGGLLAIALAGTMALAVGTNANGGSEHEHQGLKLAWNGSAWMPARETFTDSESNEFLLGSSTSSSDVWTLDRVWVPGGSTGRFEHWNGSDWNASFVPPLFKYIDAMAGDGPDDEWAVGEGFTPCGGGQATVYHWNGRKWERVTIPVCAGYYSSLSSVAVITPNELWAAGVDVEPGCMICEPYALPLLLHEVNGAWSTTYVGGSNFTGVTAVRADAANDVWAVGPYDVKHGITTDIIYHWNGVQLIGQSIVTLERSTFLNALAISSPTDIWAVGGQSHSQQGSVGALILHYNGSSWTEVKHPPSPAGPLTSVVAVGSNDVWAAGATYLAHWNGLVWKFILPSPGSAVTEVSQIPGIDAMWEIGEHPSEYLNALALDKLIHC